MSLPPIPKPLIANFPNNYSTPTSTPTTPNTNLDSITLPLNIFIALIVVLALVIVALSVIVLIRHQKTSNLAKQTFSYCYCISTISLITILKKRICLKAYNQKLTVPNQVMTMSQEIREPKKSLSRKAGSNPAQSTFQVLSLT